MASELKVNKISPESGTTLTLGDSGDTINFGSGVLPNFENLTVTGDLTVDTNSLKVDSTNNFVGIGTATPSVALDVVGAITATGNITGTLATAAQPNITSLGTLTGLTTTGDINLGDSDKINFGASNDFYIEHNGSGTFLVDQGTGNLIVRATDLYFQNSGGTENYLVATSGGGVNLRYANNIKLATTSTGIDVTGDVGGDTATISGDLTIGTDRLFVDVSAGTIGLGTTSPNHKLEMLGGTPALSIKSNNTTNGSSNILFGDTDDDDIGKIMYEHGTNSMRFTTNASERMRLTSAGYLGIGTTSPSTLIDLAAGSTGGGGGAAAGITMTNRFDSPDNSWSITPQRQGVSNTGLQIRDETDSRTDMVFDGTGKVGIGTSSPSYKLSILEGGNNFIQISQSGDAVAGSLIGRSASTNLRIQNSENAATEFWTNNTERMRIDSSGNVGIGTSSPTFNNGTGLHLNSSTTDCRFHITNSSTGSTASDGAYIVSGGTGDMLLINQENANMLFYTNATERMRIDSSGSVIIGATSTPTGSSGGIGFIAESNSRKTLITASTTTSETTLFVFRNPNGTVGGINTSGSSTAFNTSSDYRLKENVVNLTSATERLKQLSPKRFNFIADANKTVDGFLAHEVSDIVPEAISGTKDEVDADGNPVYQGIDQSKLVPLLVATIKELEARITTLENA